MKFKLLYLSFFIVFYSLPICYSQDWMIFKASDAIRDFQLHDNNMWIFSGSGLHKIDLTTEERTTWNTLNSGIPDHTYTRIAIDSSDAVWLGGPGNVSPFGPNENHIVRFDGSNWEIFNDINGDSFSSILDIKIGADGKVWFLGYFENQKLVYFENEIFHSVSPPSDEWKYFGGTAGRLGLSANGNLWATFRDTTNTYNILGEYDGTNWILHDLIQQGINLSNNSRFVHDSQGMTYVVIPTNFGHNFLKYDGNVWEFMNAPTVWSLSTQYSFRPVFVDVDDNVWLVSGDNLFSDPSGKFVKYDGNNWEEIDLEDLGFNDGYPAGIIKDSNNTTWVMYFEPTLAPTLVQSRLFKYNNNTTSLVNLSNSGLPTNNLIDVHVDKFNNKWISSYLGLTKFDGINWTVVDSAYNNTINAPDDSDLFGNVWISNSQSQIIKINSDNAISPIDLINQEREPYYHIRNLVVDKNGIVYVATGENEILVYDDGAISYMDSILVDYPGFGILEDKSYQVELDTFGNLYSMGNQLSKYNGSNWEQIPLWDNSTTIITHQFKVAPNQDIWVHNGDLFPTNDITLKIYDGTFWEDWVTPFDVLSFPQWDSNEDIWVSTNLGLCKQNGNDWICYNENNSPITPEFINGFDISLTDNVWLAMYSGGLIGFHESVLQNMNAQGVEIINSVNTIEKEMISFKLFPNPTSSEINIEVNNGYNEKGTIKIYNLLGNLVYEDKKIIEKNELINIEHLESGIYWVAIEMENGSMISKLIKE